MSLISLAAALGGLRTRNGVARAAIAVIVAGAVMTICSPLRPMLPALAQTNAGIPTQVGPTAGSAAASAGGETVPFSPEQKQAIERIVRDYLINNPEIMVETGKELEKRQTALQAEAHKRIIFEKKASIFGARSDFVMGNPTGDITLVEFFDYNCGWCKRAVDELSNLVQADANVRIVFKELPIFGENSTFAAKAAMASIKQGKYWDFHRALMKERQVTKDNVLKIAEKVGLNVATLKEEMTNPVHDVVLKENAQIAQSLGIDGTPGFIIDAKVNVGFVPADGLKEIIAEVRKAGCQIC
jgi:protein-disulfide isomerase